MTAQNPNISWFTLNASRPQMKGKKGELAKAMGVRAGAVSEILSGQRDLSFAEGIKAQAFFATLFAPPAQVKVVGRIGAGQEIEPDFEQTPEDGFYQVDVPFLDVGPIGEQAIAFEVTGQSMWPRYEPGDLIICLPQERDPRDLLGREVALRTKDGKRYLKKLRSGSRPGLYNLESHNMEAIRDVDIAWASEVIHVARQGRFIPRSR